MQSGGSSSLWPGAVCVGGTGEGSGIRRLGGSMGPVEKVVGAPGGRGTGLESRAGGQMVHHRLKQYITTSLQHHTTTPIHPYTHLPIVVSVLTTVSPITHSLSIAAIAIMPVT